jgi:hypothetical protein
MFNSLLFNADRFNGSIQAGTTLFSVQPVTGYSAIDDITLVQQVFLFSVDDVTSVASAATVELVFSGGRLSVANCQTATDIEVLTITLNSNGSGIRSPSGTAYTPRSITGEQLTIRRYSNGAWT